MHGNKYSKMALFSHFFVAYYIIDDKGHIILQIFSNLAKIRVLCKL